MKKVFREAVNGQGSYISSINKSGSDNAGAQQIGTNTNCTIWYGRKSARPTTVVYARCDNSSNEGLASARQRFSRCTKTTTSSPQYACREARLETLSGNGSSAERDTMRPQVHDGCSRAVEMHEGQGALLAAALKVIRVVSN
ncbi:hypothetical protein Tco_1107797 [Tanacetum coccineum]